MISHFRSKYGNYLVEFLAIIFGVLVGFALNSWREDKSDKKQERFYLQELSANLAADNNRLQIVIQNQQEILETLDILLTIMPEATESQKARIDSLFLISRNNETFFPTVGAYKAMVSEGALKLVSNKELLTSIVELYEFYYVRINYLGTVLDGVVEKITWERRKFYSLHKSAFLSMNAVRDPEVAAMLDQRFGFIGLYLSHAERTFRQIGRVQEALAEERSKLEKL